MAQTYFEVAFINETEDGPTAVLTLKNSPQKGRIQLYNFTATSVNDYEAFIASPSILTFRDAYGYGVRLTRGDDYVIIDMIRTHPWTNFLKEGPVSANMPLEWFIPALQQLLEA